MLRNKEDESWRTKPESLLLLAQRAKCVINRQKENSILAIKRVPAKDFLHHRNRQKTFIVGRNTSWCGGRGVESFGKSSKSKFFFIKGILMQSRKSPYIFVLTQKQYPENVAFLILRILELFAREACKFL